MESQRAQITKAILKRGTKFKRSCLKDSIHRVKRQPTGWEKALVNHISDKGLTPRTYTELLKLSINENPIKKNHKAPDISPKKI